MTCANCPYCVEGMRDANDVPCTACIKMPSNDPAGCGYMIIDGFDYDKEKAWFCPLKEKRVTNILDATIADQTVTIERKCLTTISAKQNDTPSTIAFFYLKT